MCNKITLGDRNGVRTPMQWSPYRNSGFSKAEPARLFSPLIMDPVYGYEAVNVEGQVNDPSSLLHWMRNMIALRKLFKVFGRGTIEFLHPKNRKVLAYLRRYENDQILCVANLSRFAQPVELDLIPFAGMKPIEMFGYSEFPVIGTNAYQLSLNPYGFYWFELQRSSEPVEPRLTPQHDEATELQVVGWRDLFESEAGEVLESQILPPFLAAQAWFGMNGRQIDSVRIRDWIEFSGQTRSLAAVLLRVRYSSGDSEEYSLPLAMTPADGETTDKSPGNILCRVRLPEGPGVLHDGVMDDSLCRAILQLIKSGKELRTRRGVIRASTTTAFERVYAAAASDGKVECSEGRDSTVSAGRKTTLTLYRKLESGVHPDSEIRRFLSEEAGFDRVPIVTVLVEYVPAESDVETLAVLDGGV